MPVIDIPVHEKTKADKDYRYGCHNKPRTREPYLAPDGYIKTHDHRHGGAIVMVRLSPVEDTSSLDCKNERSLIDAPCEGCCHRGVGEAYWAEYRKRIDSH